MYVNVCICMYMNGHTFSKGQDQPGKFANPARGELDRQNKFPCPRLQAMLIGLGKNLNRNLCSEHACVGFRRGILVETYIIKGS